MSKVEYHTAAQREARRIVEMFKIRMVVTVDIIAREEAAKACAIIHVQEINKMLTELSQVYSSMKYAIEYQHSILSEIEKM